MQPDEYFGRVRTLIDRLEAAGNDDIANEVQRGMNRLNGLTDGWALFIASLQQVREVHGDRLSEDLKSEIEALQNQATDALGR